MANEVSKFDRMVWPIGIVVGLVIVILINAVFIYIAVSGKDEVVSTYHTEAR